MNELLSNCISLIYKTELQYSQGFSNYSPTELSTPSATAKISATTRIRSFIFDGEKYLMDKKDICSLREKFRLTKNKIILILRPKIFNPDQQGSLFG